MRCLQINQHSIGPGQPVYTVAEMSANHGRDFEQAVRILKAAKACGADAVKIQPYTPDTITIDCHNKYFAIEGTIWSGRNLHDLYREAYTPWDWQPRLSRVASEIGLDLFSTPFDDTAVDFLEAMEVPCYKVASFEVGDLQLLRKIAATGKPVILSTGMATLAEIGEAVQTLRAAGQDQIALLKCTSAYPANPEEMNLRTIPHLAEAFQVPVGLSDHTLEVTVPIVAVALGACIIEKHLTLSRSIPGPDSAFSLEPHEFEAMVNAVRIGEKAVGRVRYGATASEKQSLVHRRSLFVIQDVKAGQELTAENVRSIRPGHGLHPRYLELVLGRKAARDIARGTPLTWDLVGGF